MHRIFAPAIAVLNRMGYTKKFTLLWVLSMIAIAVVVYGLFVNLDRIIGPSERRLEGLELVEPITRAMQAMQLHRGLSASLLGGNKSMSDRRAAQEKEVIDSLKVLEEKVPPRLTGTEDYLHIQTEWAQIQKDGLKWSVADSLGVHTHLIEHVQLFEQQMADEHLLVMDPDIASYYLVDITTNRLMQVLEHLGRLRAYGTGVLARKRLTEGDEVELKVMIARLDDTLRHLSFGVDSVSRRNPAIHGVLSNVYRDVEGSVRLMTDLVEADMLSGRLATSPETFLDNSTAQIDRSYAQLYDTLLPMAKRLTQAHIDHARKELLTSVGISMLVFLLVVYLSVSIYYAIVNNIQAIARAARAFAGGNLDTRVELDTRDELSQIGNSFNEMADGFNILLQTHREDEERLRSTIETAMDAVVQMDNKGIITGWNGQAEKIFGWAREEAVGRVLGETIVPPQYREAHTRGLEHFMFSGEGPVLNSRVEMTGMRRDGSEFPVELSITAINTPSKHEFNGFIRDITRQKESEELIWNQANFDTLTGLPNRHMFQDRLEQDIKKAHRAGLKTALLFIDLDKFKEVNDTLGHSMGDILLKEAARRIVSCVRDTDTVARLGGDEFTVILPELGDTGSIERIAGNILQELASPYQLENQVAYVSASIGITLYPMDATDPGDLLKNADQAMYAAKNAGRNRFSYFTQTMQQAAQARLRLTNELRGALAANQFEVYYQPVVDMVTGRIIKAEALIRWHNSELGPVSPAQFIPLAEETGQIVEIGDWVFRESARQLKRWMELYNAGFKISVNMSPAQCTGFQLSVNVSPVQFRSISPHRTWSEYMRELELPQQSMVIEITEGLLLDADAGITDKLGDFRDIGIQVAIDDFGTGYSSLSYLKKFAIDYLKIDQSFVRDLETDPNDLALCEAIIVMAHKLGLRVIAEGVETEAQRKLLADAGCDFAQGYLFSRPVPAAEFESLLKNAVVGTQSGR